jgi:hypothetical protein
MLLFFIFASSSSTCTSLYLLLLIVMSFYCYERFYNSVQTPVSHLTFCVCVYSSYNKINGVYACEQPVTLLAFKKMGFLGWMMSDWGATHSVSINQGLDQDCICGVRDEDGVSRLDDVRLEGHT